jgi:thiol-disulfide isomerase/thioredoxin
MDTINNYVSRIEALPNSKKLILFIIAIVVVFIIVEVIMSYFNSKNNIVNHSKVDQFKNDEDEDEEEDEEKPSKPKKISLDGDKLNLTLFFAHWCGHCKKFIKDTWKELKDKYEDHDQVQLNDVDCTNIKSRITTPKGNDIEGFPTIIINFKDKSGEIQEEEYKGGRSVKHLVAFIEKRIR